MIQSTPKKVFIQANKSQRIGALLGKYSIERASPGIQVEILQVEEIPAFQSFNGKTYKHGNEERTYNLADEQSFTLTRFMPPQRMEYQGRAIVIDPDVFAVQDITPLFDLDLDETTVACCRRHEGDFWDTSVMLLENSRLDWVIEEILAKLSAKEINYNAAIRRVLNAEVLEIPRLWNSLDHKDEETRMIHYTRQRTQPWKTGLPFTVTPRKLGKILGIIPREWIMGSKKYPNTYQPHKNRAAEQFFFALLSDALDSKAIDTQVIEEEIEYKRVRPDILERMRQLTTT